MMRNVIKKYHKDTKEKVDAIQWTNDSGLALVEFIDNSKYVSMEISDTAYEAGSGTPILVGVEVMESINRRCRMEKGYWLTRNAKGEFKVYEDDSMKWWYKDEIDINNSIEPINVYHIDSSCMVKALQLTEHNLNDVIEFIDDAVSTTTLNPTTIVVKMNNNSDIIVRFNDWVIKDQLGGINVVRYASFDKLYTTNISDTNTYKMLIDKTSKRLMDNDSVLNSTKLLKEQDSQSNETTINISAKIDSNQLRAILDKAKDININMSEVNEANIIF